jgi:hypothetical protein
VGEAADKVRREAGHVAGDLYEKGKEKVGEVYEDVTAKAGEAYEDVKEKLGGIGTSPNGPAEGQSTYRH